MKPRVPGCLIALVAIALIGAGLVLAWAHSQPVRDEVDIEMSWPPLPQVGASLRVHCPPGMELVLVELHGQSTTQRTLVSGASLDRLVVRAAPAWFDTDARVGAIGLGLDPAGWDRDHVLGQASGLLESSLKPGEQDMLYDLTPAGGTRTAIVLGVRRER